MLSVKPTMADEQSISRVFNGVTLTGTYSLQDGIVTLRTALGNKTAQLLGSDLATLASIMLRELYQDMRRAGTNCHREPQREKLPDDGAFGQGVSNCDDAD